MAERALDSQHWSQRWMRIARVGADAVVLYDRHAPIDIEGCGRGRCSPLHHPAQPSGVRYSVIRFWGM
jgi:hypothetical protein